MNNPILRGATRGNTSRRLSGRAALLLGSALLPMVMGSIAHAQVGETVVLEEGRTPTPVKLGAGDDRVVVDIKRVNADTGVLDLSGLTSEALTDDGGRDSVWLRATTTQTRNVVFPNVSGGTSQQFVRADAADGAPFDGGTVYEASGNDTVLTLENRSRSPIPSDPTKPPSNALLDLRHGPLQFAGDGTVVLSFSLQASNQPEGGQTAINVVPGSTLSDGGGAGDGKLSLVAQGDVTGGAVGGSLIDVSHAGSFRLTNGARVSLVSGTGIYGGDADVFLDANTWVNATDADVSALILVRGSGRIFNSTKMTVGGQYGSPTAIGSGVFLEGGKFYNTLTEANTGAGVASGGLGVVLGGRSGVTSFGKSYIENVGEIHAATGAAIENVDSDGTLVTRNTIWNFSKGGTLAGKIVGGIVDDRQIAYQSNGVSTDVLVNSGTIEGDVLFGDGSSMFLYTGAGNGVAGNIDGGAETDGYGKSFSASATHVLSNLVLIQAGISGFEMHGIEASGPDTIVTLTAGETLNAGLMLIGDGTVVNIADITAEGRGVWSRQIANIAGGMDFINRGAITSVLGYGFQGENLSSFSNEGTIRSGTSVATYIDAGQDGRGPAFQFTNKGLIESATLRDSAVLLLFHNQGTNDLIADVTNSGTIRHLGEMEHDDDEQYALAMQTSLQRELGENYRMRATNTGTIEAIGQGFTGMLMRGHELDLVNESIIRGTNAAAGGVRFATNTDGVRPRTAATLVNRGTISGGSGAIIDDEGNTARIAYGALFAFGPSSQGGEASIVNEGTIEVGSEGVAIAVEGGRNEASAFTLDNRGTVRGGAGYTIGDEFYLLTADILADGGRTIAGAIHTRNSVDSITNRGSIIGSVDLGDLDDVFRNYGRIDGDIFLGRGANTFVVGSGSVINGTVDGGGIGNRIEVDLTGSDDKRINFSQFKHFDSLTTLAGSAGTGRVSIFGDTDRRWMLLKDLTVYIDQGDTLRSASGATGNTLGSNEEIETREIVNNAGTIEGAVSLGAGDDVLNNSGAIGFNVNMGTGDDIVVNSGTINGLVDLGAGNDRYEAQNGGLVMGAIDGGDGNDTFVFRLNGNSGSIPGGFTNFESFGAYGQGTLSLALNQNYETIELYEGANLALSDGNGTVGQIRGDDRAQIVTIEDADFAGGVALAGGNDTLGLQLSGRLAGALDGGDGTDTLKLNLTGTASINDLFNFEVVDVTGGSPLTLTGTLGAGQRINFDGSDNRFIVDTGAVFQGSANGGDGTDTLEINTGAANSRTIVAGQLTSFERLAAGGQGTLALNGQAYSFDSVDVGGNLSVGDGASLASANGVHFGSGDNRLTLDGTGTVTSPVEGGDGTDTLAFNLAQGQTRNLSGVSAVSGFEVLAASGAGTLHVDRNASYQSVALEGGQLSIAGGATLTGNIAGGNAADVLTVHADGAVVGSLALGGGNDVVANSGTITGNVDLGDGNDRYVAQAGGVVTGTIDGGAGDNIFVFRLDGIQGSIPGSVLNFSSFGAYGPGTLTVSLDAGQAYGNLELIEGANLILSGANGSVANVIGDASAQSVTIGGTLTGGVSLGGGDDNLSMQLSGLLQGALDGGEGTDTLNLTLTGASTIAGLHGFEIANIAGASPLTLAGDLGANQRVNFTGDADNELIIAAGTRFEGTVDGGAGDDLLRVRSGSAESRTVVASQILAFEDLVSEGPGTLVLTGGPYSFDSVAVNGGNLELGTGTHLGTVHGIVFDGADNRFTIGAGAEVSGTIEGGAGNDTLALVQGTQWARLLSLVQATGFERLQSSGIGELRIDRNASFANGVGLDGGTFNVLAGNVLGADVTGGSAREAVIVGGRIDGNLDLGAGDDSLTISGGGLITGTRLGGDGADTLIFNTSGTTAAPTTFDAGAWTGFEALNVEGGVVSLTGSGSYSAINVAGGRLIGQAGSVISATGPIQVAHSATFGSAGRVNGDILVAGTLAPGASPGTMTVNGNVSFQPGSNLLLEVSPAASDLLNISGTLTIANGATMDITGVLHGVPGNRLDLVVAQGGITGRFTTINKSNDIFGFVVQNGNRLQIQSEFLNDDAYPTNVRASVDYANEVLRDGFGVQAFTAALPVLVDAQGAIDQRAFAQLTPEAYGSAIQLGEENSLLLVDGVQSATATKAGHEGLYGFGQFLGGRADLAGTDGVSGATSSRITNRGFFGGMGYGLDGGTQVGAFVGGLDSKQVIQSLGAKTEMDALAGGVFADATFGRLGLHGLVAVNSGKAETKRDLLVRDGTGKAKYDLTSWIVDLGVDYRLHFGAWTIAPKLGVTYARTNRGAANEQGLGDFSLSVDKGNRNSWLGEAAIAASGSIDLGGAKVTPYAQAGIRQMLGGARVLVSGRYADADTAIMVNGIEREGTAVRVALGLGIDVTEGVRLQAGYAGEFAGTKRDSVTGGMTVRF